jgi:hypothetical protein
VTVFGAWCFRPSAADVEFAASIGLTRLDCMINELSKARAPQKFTYVKHDYLTFAKRCEDNGIRVSFTSWVMPHVEFCKEAVSVLTGLSSYAPACARLLPVLDAEEPWSQAERPQYDEAIDTLNRGMAFMVSGIGWASKWTMRLAASSSGVIPQLYSTTTSKLDPNEYGGPLAHWAKHSTRIIPALAAYRTTPAVLRAAIAEVSPTDTILLWALRHLRAKSGASLRKVIAEAAKEREAA